MGRQHWWWSAHPRGGSRVMAFPSRIAQPPPMARSWSGGMRVRHMGRFGGKPLQTPARHQRQWTTPSWSRRYPRSLRLSITSDSCRSNLSLVHGAPIAIRLFLTFDFQSHSDTAQLLRWCRFAVQHANYHNQSHSGTAPRHSSKRLTLFPQTKQTKSYLFSNS